MKLRLIYLWVGVSCVVEDIQSLTNKNKVKPQFLYGPTNVNAIQYCPI